MALSLTLEAAELLECFQWKAPQEVEKYLKTHKDEVAMELADVFSWVLLMSHDMGIDISESMEKKLKINAKKYPIGTSRGSHKKYSQQ